MSPSKTQLWSAWNLWFQCCLIFQMLQDYRQTRMENMRQQMQQEIESRVNELNAAIAGKSVGLATNSIIQFTIWKTHPCKSMTLIWPAWRSQDTVKNKWSKPWLSVCRSHFFLLIVKSQQQIWIVLVSRPVGNQMGKGKTPLGEVMGPSSPYSDAGSTIFSGNQRTTVMKI